MPAFPHDGHLLEPIVTQGGGFGMVNSCRSSLPLTAPSAMGVPTESLCRVLELAVADSPLGKTLGELI
jgi:hypothetical protein